MTTYTLTIPSAGSYGTNTLSADFTNTAATVSSSGGSLFLAANDITDYVVKSIGAHDTRDMEVTTWVSLGYAFLRLDSNGKAIYFFHNNSTANGTVEAGIVTGLTETAYPSGTYYKLYTNTTCTTSITGYSKSYNSGDTFTFGVSGFDIYIKYKGTEFCRFKDYRQMASGAMALKSQASFRDIVHETLSTASLFSNYSSGQLDLRDWNVRSIQTTGAISAGASILTIPSSAGFQVGDWVIVEIGAEAGTGGRGTIGVGGQWPAKTYSSAAVMNATSAAVNTFAWIQTTGDVYQYTGGAWTTSFVKTYYVTKAIPYSLHGRISAISTSGTTVTLGSSASATVTSANVYLDNQPYINYITSAQDNWYGFDLSTVTPTSMEVIIPSGSYAGSGVIRFSPQNGWSLTGLGQGTSALFAPNGVYSLNIWASQYDNYTLSDFKLTGNWGVERYGLAIDGWTHIQNGLDTSGRMLANGDTNSYHLTQTNIPSALMYPPGVFVSADNSTIQDITVNEVSQKAVGVDLSTNTWAYRCTNNQTSEQQEYIQWLFNWTSTTGGGAVDCVVNSTYLNQAFEAFNSDGTQFLRPISVNGAFSMNNTQNWLIQDATITTTAHSAPPPAWSVFNYMININTNFGGGSNVSSGGTIDNAYIDVQGRINSSNDVPRGIVVGASNPNVTITNGRYQGPEWASPSTLGGPVGIISTGINTAITGFRCCGAVKLPAVGENANISIDNGTVSGCQADNIVLGGSATAGSPNSACSYRSRVRIRGRI